MLTFLCAFTLSLTATFLPAVESYPASGRGLLGLEVGIHEGQWAIMEEQQVLYTGTYNDCHNKRLKILKKRHGNGRLNVRMPTLGGKDYWADCYHLDGWRIQRHVWTGHYRLLDHKDIRIAWGTYEGCRVALAYKRKAYGYGQKRETSVVVILHGTTRNRNPMLKMGYALEENGYEVLNINYPSRHLLIKDFAAQVHALLNERHDIREVSFVTHSMGGLIVRKMLADENQPWRQRATLKRAVLLFPPNQGAHKANIWHEKWWYKCVFGPSGRELCTDIASKLPTIPIKTGIIIGAQGNDKGKCKRIPGDDDGTVGVEEAKLDGVAAYAYHKVGHTFGMKNDKVIEDIVSFVNDGEFISDNVEIVESCRE